VGDCSIYRDRGSYNIGPWHTQVDHRVGEPWVLCKLLNGWNTTLSESEAGLIRATGPASPITCIISLPIYSANNTCVLSSSTQTTGCATGVCIHIRRRRCTMHTSLVAPVPQALSSKTTARAISAHPWVPPLQPRAHGPQTAREETWMYAHTFNSFACAYKTSKLQVMTCMAYTCTSPQAHSRNIAHMPT
jgi:hypothetical protein